MTPIMAAAINGDWEAVEFLMDRKAELDNKDLKDQSIVHLAAQYDQHELIENLLDHKRTERDFMVNENDQYVSSLTEINLIFLLCFYISMPGQHPATYCQPEWIPGDSEGSVERKSNITRN